MSDRLGNHRVDHAHDAVDHRVRPLIGARRLRAKCDHVAAILGQRAGDDVRAAKVNANEILASRRHETGKQKSCLRLCYQAKVLKT